MRREPSLTFEGALRILGQHEHKTIERIDKLLGGVILGGGAAAGAVTLGMTPLAPVAAFGVVWGWVEQKGLAVDLLKNAVDAVSGKISGLGGLEKRELIAAAHSTIVVASVFESLRDHVGEEFYGLLKITDDEKKSLIDKLAHDQRDVGGLYASEIPAPSAACGFEENAKRIAQWQTEYSFYLFSFIGGLAVAEKRKIVWSDVRDAAVERYRSRYLELAAKVPEFAIWAELGEHAATRTSIGEVGAQVVGGIAGLSADVTDLRTDVGDIGVAIRESNAEVAAALDANRDALNRVAALLETGAPSGTDCAVALPRDTRPHAQPPGLRASVSWANAGILEESIIRADPGRYPADLTIPLVKEIYINPRYRVARLDEVARPADDRWWRERPSHDDFDVLLAAHVMSPDATRLPLLLLGHPGAGKSLLTTVLAARLPYSEYTVVRVPLRQVSADARIHRQIEEALESSTGQRIAWSELAQQSMDTVRVVLLDGLDELLQASEHDRSSYLEDVVDFQNLEATQRRPVVVIVTSRTVVADRVRIPGGTTLVKLDPFNDDDIAAWLLRWRRVNGGAIAAGTMSELTVSAVRRQPELAEQPLLLMMLALYAADPKLPPLDEDMPTAELYRRLLDEFARREAGKELGFGRDPSPDQLEQRVTDHLDRLAVAALGMFNRGRQDVSEEDLGKDLDVLGLWPMERSRHAEAGQRIIGQFFFIHAPEARTVSDRQAPGGERRTYEFLHATFGEYLVARRVMDEIVDVAAKAFSGRRGPTDPDDDLLFALLSHQVLPVRQSTLGFAREIFADLDDTIRQQVLETLEILVRTYRNRHGSDRYAAYRPVPPDQVRQLACYSANLVTLRVVLPGPQLTPLAELLRVPDSPASALQEWRVTPLLWRAGLDTDGLRAILTTIKMGYSPPILFDGRDELSLMPSELALARLIGDEAAEKRLRYGTAIYDEMTYFYEVESWTDMTKSWLIPAIAGIGRVPTLIPTPPTGTPDGEIVEVAELIFKYLRSSSYHEPWYKRVLKLLFDMPPVFRMDELALTAAVIGRPGLRDAVPELQNFEIYGHYAEIVRRADLKYDRRIKAEIEYWHDHPSNHVMYVVEEILRKRLDLRKDELPACSPGLGREPGAEAVFG